MKSLMINNLHSNILYIKNELIEKQQQYKLTNLIVYITAAAAATVVCK